MKMIQANGMIDTNNWQKDYIWQYHEPIPIGTRLCEMVKSGYLVSNQWKKYNYYTLTDKGIDWNGEELIIKQYPKIKKTRAESEAKVDSKFINDELDKHYWVVEHTPPYKFSFVEWIKSILS